MSNTMTHTDNASVTSKADGSSAKRQPSKAPRTPPGGNSEKVGNDSPPATASLNTEARKGCALSADADAGSSMPKSPASPRPTKAAMVEGLLSRGGGASMEALCEVTGWQAHTCRAFLSGLRKKGREINRSADDTGSFVYVLSPASFPTGSAAKASGGSK